MTYPDIYSEVIKLLEDSPQTLREIAIGADVNYHWLGKLSQGKFDDPGVRRMQKLYQYLKQQAA